MRGPLFDPYGRRDSSKNEELQPIQVVFGLHLIPDCG